MVPVLEGLVDSPQRDRCAHQCSTRRQRLTRRSRLCKIPYSTIAMTAPNASVHAKTAATFCELNAELIADPARHPEDLDQHDHLPCEREPEARAGEQERCDRRKPQRAQSNGRRKAKDLRHLDEIRIDGAHALREVERDRRVKDVGSPLFEMRLLQAQEHVKLGGMTVVIVRRVAQFDPPPVRTVPHPARRGREDRRPVGWARS